MKPPILLLPESTPLEVIEALANAKSGDIVGVPDDFRFIELDPERKTVKERGFRFELTPEGLRRLA